MLNAQYKHTELSRTCKYTHFVHTLYSWQRLLIGDNNTEDAVSYVIMAFAYWYRVSLAVVDMGGEETPKRVPTVSISHHVVIKESF